MKHVLWALFALLWLGVFAWYFRYDYEVGIAYNLEQHVRYDRWTGNVEKWIETRPDSLGAPVARTGYWSLIHTHTTE